MNLHLHIVCHKLAYAQKQRRNGEKYAGASNNRHKESWHDEFLEWICGYANAYGGTLYIGKNDDGEVVGLSDKEKSCWKLSPIKL